MPLNKETKKKNRLKYKEDTFFDLMAYQPAYLLPNPFLYI